MKNRSWILVIACLFSSMAMAGVTRVEIPLETAMIAPRGFDDNDNVQAVVRGFLPNICYSVADYMIEPVPSRRALRIRQFAMRDTSGICAQDSQLPPHLKATVPFTTEVSFGILQQGPHRIEYLRADGQPTYRAFIVSQSSVPTVDTLPYAAVTNLVAEDFHDARRELEVTISGYLNNSCTDLNEDIQILRMGDVFAILPTIRVRTGGMCMEMIRPFERRISLGHVKPGNYLVHVRSMSGRALNRVTEATVRMGR